MVTAPQPPKTMAKAPANSAEHFLKRCKSPPLYHF
jgi:hypothetical protein